MSYLLPHLRTGWAVDQAILNEEDRVVVIRFGHDYDPVCMQMDEALSKIVEKVKNFAVIYLVDITEVPDFNTMRLLAAPPATQGEAPPKQVPVLGRARLA
ncbi:mitosis protein DIM1 [Aureococcus anophagefferens]|nr:mitosis protein DIM1 [Aureococcus anophagefferens]